MAGPKILWWELPRGMTISVHDKHGRAHMSFRCDHFGGNKVAGSKRITFEYDNYQEKYDEAIAWIKANRSDYVKPTTPLTRSRIMNRLGLKRVIIKKSVLLFT